MDKEKPMLSLLCPSRERADDLKFSLDSLGLERNNLEVLVWIDNDDPQLSKYRKMFSKSQHIKLFIKPRIGYISSHKMYDFLCSKAIGDWMMLWNDDAYMDGPEWYDTFSEYSSLSNPNAEPVIYNIWRHEKPQNAFPVLSRRYYEIVGRMSGHPIVDLWIKSVAYYSHIQRYIMGIRPHHRNHGSDEKGLGDLKDATNKYSLETHHRMQKSAAHNFSGQPSRSGRQTDILKIQGFIKNSHNRSLRVGFVGLGKLGLPVALAVESRGKNVLAYDISPNVPEYIRDKKIPFNERNAEKLLQHTAIEMADSIKDVVKKCSMVFCAVQTPHDPKFEGDKPLIEKPVDFDYTYLKNAVKDIVEAANELDEKTTLVVISTCLPGTYYREIKPLLSQKINYIYNPYFIAMGTVIDDFLNPEMVLIGTDDGDAKSLVDFYKMMYSVDKSFVTDITTAEGIKVLYNTFITTKIVFANIYGEMAHKLGMDSDDIYKALSLATDRIISSKYLRPGVGDGGGCHPRDNIALSYIADKIGLSFNLFDALMSAREKHMSWLANLAMGEAESAGLPIVVLGKSFKPETNIVTGSPATLLASFLKARKTKFIHWEFDYPQELPKAVYIVATQHKDYINLDFPDGSIVIDPHRYIKKREGVKVVSIGGKTSNS